MIPKEFVAIDFETATGSPDSACQVGIVTMRNGEIVEEYESLIRPPGNEFAYWNSKIHGILPEDTYDSPSFLDLADSILPRLENKIIVAHNAIFDKKVLQKTMEYYKLHKQDYAIARQWECTLKIYRRKGYKKNNLRACCERLDIELQHHDALSDARGCALLYLKHHQSVGTNS